MVERKISYSRTLVLIILLFLLFVNGFLGTVLIVQSRKNLKVQMEERMLDILNSAAMMIDGDVLAKLQKEDNNTPQYQQVLKILGAFQQNFNLDFIYGIRNMGNGNFTFTVDPDLESPGEFGEPVVSTEALRTASLGTPAVDQVPYEDKWGRFYSAYTPVFDSQGKVGGILAVDVEASFYETELRRHIYTALIICAASLIVGGIIAYLISDKIHRRLYVLNVEMSRLSDEVEELAGELKVASGYKTDSFEIKKHQTQDLGELDELSARLKFMRLELRQFIDDARELAYMDPLTGAGNRAAYVDAIKYLNSQIENGNAEFMLSVLDINGVKNANDSFGHEFGDKMIITASEIIKESVGLENLFRIGGDEFVVIIENITKEEVDDIFNKIDAKVAQRNEEIEDFKTKMSLAISKGAALFKSNSDVDVQSVFRRADAAMYADKAAYYKTHDRRQRR